MDAIALISIFPPKTTIHLIGPYKNTELFVGNVYACQKWLKQNPDFDIFPDEGGIWVQADGVSEISILLDQIDMEVM